MALPRYQGKETLPASYTPSVFLDALRASGWEPGVVPATVIYTYARFELYLANQPNAYTPNHMLGTGPGRFFLVNRTDGTVGINCMGTGPSATAAQLELQAALGIRRALIVGTAGGLHPNQQPGDVVVPSEAVRTDGTSDHYALADVPARPDEALAGRLDEFLRSRGLDTSTAPCWTTAAPFRTTTEEVEFYRVTACGQSRKRPPHCLSSPRPVACRLRPRWSSTGYPPRTAAGMSTFIPRKQDFSASSPTPSTSPGRSTANGPRRRARDRFDDRVTRQRVWVVRMRADASRSGAST